MADSALCVIVDVRKIIYAICARLAVFPACCTLAVVARVFVDLFPRACQ